MTDERESIRVKGYQLSPELFETGYAAGNGVFQCPGVCCVNGAYVDIAERDLILKHADEIKAHMDETQPHDVKDWFDAEEKVDADYPSGRCIGTAVKNGGCVLRDKRGWCSLQVAATATGRHKWAFKGLYCVLFPVEVIAGVIRFNPFMLKEQRPCCSPQPVFVTPLYEACRDELVHLLGEDGYAEVDAHYHALRDKPRKKLNIVDGPA